MNRSVIATILAATLIPASSPAAANDTPASQTLFIAVLQGGGAVNNIKTGAITVPIVEVHDQSMKPVAGAEVTFELPAAGPGGVFSGGVAVAHAKTNTAGQARAPEFAPAHEGRFFIQVSARLGDRTGATRIAQSNSSNSFSTGVAPERGGSKIWKVLAVAGGGAITAGLIMLSRGGGGGSGSSGSTSTGTPTITLTPGAITVGGPR